MKVKELRAIATKAAAKARKSKDPVCMRAWIMLSRAAREILYAREQLEDLRESRKQAVVGKKEALQRFKDKGTREQVRDAQARVVQAEKAVKETPKE